MIKTIHLILHSHIDPVWLWPWQAGLDMALATCRTACNMLDAHPEIVFTFGDAWAFALIERTEGRLFERIKAHVAAGRWELAGGWWAQPDCNFPSEWGFTRQIELGRQYLEPRFGRFPRTGFNIDSFGHAATLPRIMRAAGQDRYVMMRPMPGQMRLPARLFRWRGWEGDPEVTTFRIATEYQARPPLADRLGHLRSSLSDLPEGVTHTMCFIGVGDHGGGVTEKMIQWCRRNTDVIDGAQLLFSSPARFFDAVAGETERLPLVTGELQYDAIGCYSVQRSVKGGVRRAEHLLRRVELSLSPDDKELTAAWRRVCFNQFHDTLCGTCIPSAYRQVEAQLGAATAWGDEQLQLTLRRRMSELPDDPTQRIVLWNASEQPFAGYVEFEPWREISVSVPEYRLLDERGNAVAYQAIEPESLGPWCSRILFHARLGPGELRTLRLDMSRSRPRPVPSSGLHRGGDVEELLATLAPPALPLPQLQLIEDGTDTWGHGSDRFAESPVEAATWQPPQRIESGPLRLALYQKGMIGQSPVWAEWRRYADTPFIEVVLGVDWREAQKVLKWTLVLPAAAVARTDGVPGAALQRGNDGAERPLRDWTLLELEGGARLGIACPDVYALDATADRLRLTLLRGPVMAHHAPHGGVAPRRIFADRGLHTFAFRLFAGRELSPALLEQHALMMQRPPLVADLTRGMPPLVDEGFYNPMRK